MEANLNELMEIDKTEDKHFLPKIIELHREGVDLKTLESIFFQRYAIESWLRDTNMDDKDPIELRKDNTKGIFRQNQYKLDGVKELWLSSVIYEDNDVTINRPESFQVSQAIGYPIWCYSYNQNSWDEHYIGNQEAIYMVHNVMEDGDMEYTTVMVSPNGKMLVLDANHKTIKGNELKTYLKSICDAANYLLPQTTDSNKTDINCSKNMNKKNTIRLTESDLKRVISESVKNIMTEGDLLDFYKDKEDKSGKLSEKILILRSDAIQLYEFINKGDGLWGYRVGDSREIQQERLNLASDIIKAINKLYKSVNEDDFNKVERFRKFGV
jgi:hypothetical protein